MSRPNLITLPAVVLAVCTGACAEQGSFYWLPDRSVVVEISRREFYPTSSSRRWSMAVRRQDGGEASLVMTPLDEKADRINLYRSGPASLFAVDKHGAYEIDTAAIQVNASSSPLPAGATYLGCFGPSYGMFAFMEPERCPEQPVKATPEKEHAG